MNYLVAKLIAAGPTVAARPRGIADLGTPTGGINFPREDVVKQYHTSEGAALAEAENLAKRYPGEQFAVFAVKAIRESKATLIKKTINEAGEIVVDQDAS